MSVYVMLDQVSSRCARVTWLLHVRKG